MLLKDSFIFDHFQIFYVFSVFLLNSIFDKTNLQLTSISWWADSMIARFTLVVNWLTHAKKSPIYTRTSWTQRFFFSTSTLKASNPLKSLKLTWRFVLTSCDIYQNPFTQEKILKFWQCQQKKNYKTFSLKKLTYIWKRITSDLFLFIVLVRSLNHDLEPF
jgi:hypothetical protein